MPAAGHFSIGDRPARPAPAEGEEVEIAQPFAVEVGDSLAFGEGFAVAALRSQGDGSGAVVALVSADGSRGTAIDLGRVHGDVDPPALARRGDDLFVAVSDNDVSSGALRLATIRGAPNKPELVWGGHAPQTRDESAAFDLQVSGERGVLVWDEEDKRAHHSVIRLVSFDAGNPATVTLPRSISPDKLDREMPQVAPRPGGYWLAWVASLSEEAPKHAGQGVPHRAKPSGDAGADFDPESEANSVLELGNRFIELVPLDANGAPATAPVAITPRDRHVLVFDLAPAPEGGALLAWRDDDTSPGAEGRFVHLARVRTGGAIERTLVDDEDVGAGAPSLVFDADDASPPSWLSLESISDETRLSALGPGGALLDALAPEPAVGSADVLTANHGRLLIARPRGLAVQLSVVRCKPGPPPPPAPSAAPAPTPSASGG